MLYIYVSFFFYFLIMKDSFIVVISDFVVCFIEDGEIGFLIVF